VLEGPVLHVPRQVDVATSSHADAWVVRVHVMPPPKGRDSAIRQSKAAHART
jgi:hypothetical protein